jgi:signal transduction histidine kinase
MSDGPGFSIPDAHDRLLELGRLAGGLVHEIKNPLGVVAMNAELLREQVARAGLPDTERERMARRLGRISESVANLQAIVQSFLQFARPARPDPEAVDVNAVLRRLLDEQAEALAADQVAASFHPDEALLYVPADPQHLASVFRNVLVNAREALRERPGDRRILVATRSAPQAVRVVIANNGPPIPERIAANLFEPFTSSKESGTGLGLAIVRRLVEMHHGTVHVSSDRDAGVSFTFEFPTPLGIARPRVELPMPAVAATIVKSEARRPRRKPKNAPHG